MALKKSSSIIQISGEVTESAVNVYTEEQIDLQLNPLDNEVFVVQSVDLNIFDPDALAGVDTNVSGCLSSTTRATLGNLSDSNVIASSSKAIRAAGFVDGGVPFVQQALETPTASNLEYVFIIATNNFFAAIDGTNNLTPKTMRFRMYGYRARADAATYAALVQSEVLSS